MKKFALFYILLFTVFNGVFAQSTNNLILSLPFNTNTLDYSGNKYDCVPMGAVLGEDRFGNTKGALYFNGVTDYAKVIDNSKLDLTQTSYTISLWIKESQRNLGANGTILSKRTASGRMGYILTSTGLTSGISDGKAYYTVSGGADDRIYYNTPIQLNTWKHIVVTYNYTQGEAKMYIDNQYVAQTLNFDYPFNTTADLYLGKDYALNDYFFNGAIDDVNIYNSELSPSQIDSLYKATPNDLIAYFPFNGDYKDYSGNNHKGIDINTSFASDRNGIVNNACAFNGVNSFVNIKDTSDLNLSKISYSISFWVKENNSSSTYNGTIVSRRTKGSMNGYILSVGGSNHPYSNHFNYSISQGADPIIISQGIIQNNWHFITLTYDKTNGVIKFYIDGVFDNQTTAFPSPNEINQDLTIGVDGLLGTYYFNGVIDELKIYKRSLSDKEIFNTYSKDQIITGNISISSVKNNEISLFPNPVTQILNSNILTQESRYEIWDINAHKIMAGQGASSINVEQLSSGIYLLVLFDDQGIISRKSKFIKE